MSFSIRKAALNFFLYLALPLILSVPLNGAELTLEPQVGFHGLFQLGHPFPLRVDLANLGRPVEGTLEVRVWKGGPTRGVDAYSFYHRREVFLSAQSRKSVQFTVDPDSISRPITVNFSSPRVTLSKEIDLRRYFSPSPLILLLTENSVSPPIPLASGSPSPLISLSTGYLPSDARAYQGVSTIIFYEQSLRDLSRPQTMALERWLSSGGRMLVLGSMHYALYQEPSMSRFLPVRVAGLKRISSLPSLERIYGEKVSSLRDLLVQDSRLVEGKILIEEKGTPILVEMSRGRGKVFYLSLDVGRPPLSHWEGLSLLFRDLLGSSPERRSPVQASWNEPVFLKLLLKLSFISTYVPAGSFLLWLLLYLGGLGLLAWLWLQQRLPRRTLVLSFLSLVAFSSFGGYLYFNRGGNIPDGVLFSSTLLESLPDGYVEAQSNVALFSTRRQYYNLQVERGWTDLEPVLPRLGAADDGAVVVQEEGSYTRFRFPLREWDYRLFKIRSMNRFPVRTEVQNHGDKIFLKLTNLTTKDLTECWLVISGQRFFLGDILQGSSQIRDFPLSSESPPFRAGQPNKVDLWEIPFDDKVREILFRYSFFPQEQGMARWGDGAVLFFGWVQGGDRRVWVDDARILTQEYTLFRAIIPLEGEGGDL
ncbi:MAG: hypothetical protein ACE5JO_00185 [Candidatus Binatia bacterium]